MAQQAAIAEDPARFARRARLAQMRSEIEARLADVDNQARTWLSDQFPTAYRLGAETVGPFRWTAIDTRAVTILATDSFSELLAATDGVSESTKALIRELAKRQALLTVTTDRTATQAARELRRLLEQRGIFAVRYRDGSRHGLADYSDMLLRTKTGMAHNAGLLNAAKRAGAQYVEVFDGFGCGWTSHADADTANGTIRSVEEAAQHVLSHPRCQRSFGPRPDVSTEREALQARPSTSPAQRADQAVAERARAVDQRSRAAARRRQAARRSAANRPGTD